MAAIYRKMKTISVITRKYKLSVIYQNIKDIYQKFPYKDTYACNFQNMKYSAKM